MKATLRALAPLFLIAFLFTASTKALGARLPTPNFCESKLFEEEVFTASLLSTSQHGQKHEIFLTLRAKSGKLFHGVFRSFKKSSEKELPSPKRSYGVFLLDEFFGRPAKVPFHSPYVLRGEDGILELTPPSLSQKKPRSLPKEQRLQVYDIALFDFLVGIQGRPKSSILVTPEGLSPQDFYWMAFRIKLTDIPFKKRADEFAYMKEVWRKASMEFKNQILYYEREYLAEDTKGFLSEEQIEDIWLRTLFLRHLDAGGIKNK